MIYYTKEYDRGKYNFLLEYFLNISPPEPTPKQARKKIQAEKRI